MTATGNGHELNTKRRAKAVAFVAAISLAFVFVFAVLAVGSVPVAQPPSSTTLSGSNSQEPNQIDHVSFTCSLGANASFTVSVAVNLQDGMNSEEATSVATAVFNHEMTHAAYVVKSAETDAEGLWTVKLSWGSVVNGEQESLSHFFDVVIDPSNRTVSYSRCY